MLVAHNVVLVDFDPENEERGKEMTDWVIQNLSARYVHLFPVGDNHFCYQVIFDCAHDWEEFCKEFNITSGD